MNRYWQLDLNPACLHATLLDNVPVGDDHSVGCDGKAGPFTPSLASAGNCAFDEHYGVIICFSDRGSRHLVPHVLLARLE